MGLVSMQMEYDLYTTPLPNIFIDDYMPYANPMFSTVYIMGFRQCFHGNTDLNSKDLSQMLGITEDFVISAWKHWQSEGIIKIIDESEENFSIEFLTIEPRNKNESVKNNEKTKKRGTEKPNRAVLETRPVYTVPEINMYASKSDEIRDLFLASERLLAKPLTFNDMSVIFSFYEWLRLPVDIITMMIDYCVSNNHRSMRYIEKVALDWADNNILTIEDAEEHIRLYNKDFREILRSFGQGRRDPTPKETALMKRWLQDLKMPLEILKEACEITLSRTGKAQFSYADKIITDLSEKNVRTKEEMLAAIEEFYKQKASEKELEDNTRPKVARKGKNKFANFEGRNVDFDAIEKLERELLMRNMEES